MCSSREIDVRAVIFAAIRIVVAQVNLVPEPSVSRLVSRVSDSSYVRQGAPQDTTSDVPWRGDITRITTSQQEGDAGTATLCLLAHDCLD